jgi:ribose transport system permease protein
MSIITASEKSGANTAPKRHDQKSQEGLILRFLRKWGTLTVIIAVAIIFSVMSPWFFTVANFNNILFSMIVSALVSIGLTYVVVAGSFDLSIGLTVTTASIVTALMIPIAGPAAAILVALLVSGLIGLINGLLVTYGRLSGIVVTLGVSFVLGGMNLFITGGYQVAVDYSETAFRFIGQGRVGWIAFPVIIMLILAAFGHLLATKTRAGYYITAVGDNPMAAYYSGIKVYFWIITAFILSAVFAGMGGVLLTSISSSAQPVGGQGYLLESFAAVYLGATIYGKGKPHILGTLIGVFFLYMLSAGMNMLGIPFAARQLANGLILILAVGANALLNREEIHLKFI